MDRKLRLVTSSNPLRGSRTEEREPPKGSAKNIYIYIQPTSAAEWHSRSAQRTPQTVVVRTRGKIIYEAFVSLLLFCLPMGVIRTFGASLCIL